MHTPTAAILLACAAAHAQPQWVTPAVTAPRVQQRTLQSAALGQPVTYHVYTPPAYDAQPARRFPVLYWLHGSNSVLSGIAPMSDWFGDAIAARKLPPVIVVFPNGLPYGMWCDSKNGVTPLESILINDLIPEVDATLRTIPSPDARIIEGFSMGGYGAARIGMSHPGLFAAVSMLGAGPLQTDFLAAPPVGSPVSPEVRLQIFEDVYGSDPAYFLARSPWSIAEQNAPAITARRLAIRQLIGELDFTLPANLDFRDRLVALDIPSDFFLAPGVGHQPLALLTARGEANWTFYQAALANPTVCYPNCDASTVAPTLNAVDFACFLQRFRDAAPYANCDGSTSAPVLNALDFTCFLTRFRAGCF